MILSRFFVAKSIGPVANAALLIASLILSRSASGELIPAARLTNWTANTRTGVIGGIPTDRTNLINVTLAPYNADRTGATNAQPALQAAINAAAAGDVVFLPSGTYRIDGTLNLGTNFSGKTLRGAGPASTIIDQRASVGLSIGSASGFGSPNPPVLVTAGLTKGSTTVTVNQMNFDQNGGPHGFLVGQIIAFQVQSDPNLPVVSVYNYDVFTNQAPTIQLVRVSAVNTTARTLTFFPPLFDAYGGGSLQVRVQYTVFQAIGIGLEDLTVDATNQGGTAFNCVQFNNCFGSWVKNCTIQRALNYPLYFQDCLNCEVRHSTLKGFSNNGSNGAGLLYNLSGSGLIEDNIILDAFPIVEINQGSSGNVFSYNYGPPGGMWDTNHGPHNQFNLYEGNAMGYQLSDGYFGSEANLTLFRNYLHGDYGINLRRWTRNASAVGNMVPSRIGDDGYPNMGNTGFDGTAQLSQGDPWRDWHMSGTLTSRTDNDTGAITLASGALFSPGQVIRLVWGTNLDQQRFATMSSVSGNVAQIVNYSGGTALPATGTTISIGPGAFYNYPNGSYQEKDLDVAATMVKKGNRYADTNNIDSLGGDTLPDSLFRLSTPSWFHDLVWPPYDPVTPRPPSIEDIPAGYRYVHGVDPPGGPPEAPQPPTDLTLDPPPGPYHFQSSGLDFRSLTSGTLRSDPLDILFHGSLREQQQLGGQLQPNLESLFPLPPRPGGKLGHQRR